MSYPKSFQELYERVKSITTPLQIVAVNPSDDASEEALRMIESNHLAAVVRVEDPQLERAASEAVALVRQNKGSVLMKGLIGTDVLLRAVLNKEEGLLPKGSVLTHLAVAEIPSYPKLLFFTDAAVIPYPTHEQRIEQVRYAARVCHHFGIEEPRIALIHCAEHGGKAFPFVDGYADIKQMAADGAFSRCIVDGPLDVKSSCDIKAQQQKGIQSPIGGEADVLVLPDLEAGNVFYKTLTLFDEIKTAGMLCGTTAPVVLPSRGDEAEAKFNSILFALASI